MRYQKLNPEMFIGNRKRLRNNLKPNSVVILHANDVLPTNADGTLKFKQNTDLFYLTGVDQEETILLLYPDSKDPKNKKHYLCVRQMI